jgi:hypothetical protein
MGVRRVLYGLSVLVVATSAVIVGPAAAYAAEPRTCRNFYTGDDSRRLSVCVSWWFDSTYANQRALVEMHTYVGTRSGWVDSRSQTITLNLATWTSSAGPVVWGTNGGSGSCRLNSTSGPNACGGTNTVRVAVYSAVHPFTFTSRRTNTVWRASWRDDRGIAHYVTENAPSHPDQMPIVHDW